MPDFKLLKPKKEKKDKNDKAEKQNKKQNRNILSVLRKPGGKLPTKTTINLARTEAGAVSVRRLMPVILLMVLALLILGKFFVFDQLVAASNATAEVTNLQTQLQNAYSAIASYDDLEDDYAHYTYSGMTEEELAQVDRVAIMELVEEVLKIGDATKSWSLSANLLTVQVTGSSLQELNELSRSLEQSDIVERCMLTTANKTDRVETATDVAATFMIYLQKPEANAQDASAGEEQTRTQQAGEEVNQ